MSIDTMLDELVRREGDYSDHPADRGGPTRWGVTEQVARAYGYKGDMRALPRQTAIDIYRQRYWLGPRFDQVAAVSPALAEELFDTGVNMGPAVATKFLQRALNLLNRQATDYPDIAADGQIGPMTIAALKSYAGKRGAAGLAVLLRLVDCFQAVRYAEIAEKNPSQEDFFFGWIANRTGPLK